MILGTGGFATYLASTEDDYKYNTWSDHKFMSQEQAKFGDFLGTGIPSIAIAATQLYFDHENGWAHSEALFFNFISTAAIKLAAQRQRPNGLNRSSMPSGHTSVTFATATHLMYAYGWKAGIPAYALAIFTGLSRVSESAHWYSDTVMGATIGILWGRATYAHHEKTGTESWLEPMEVKDGYGVRWVYRY